MRVAYFDCFSGISGDMILGALLDVGLDLEVLTSRLSRLPLQGWRLEPAREKRGHLAGTRLRVEVNTSEQPHRSCAQIRELISGSDLAHPVRESSLAIVNRLAEVEGRLHGVHPDEVHFHEIGAADSILDIVGSCIGIHELGIQRVTASALPLGRGFVRCQHGLLPLPAPATVALLKGVPVYDSGQERELVTPTGAAILTTLASEFGSLPSLKIEQVGHGVGQHPESHPPNMLRLILGSTSAALTRERLLLLETSVDDMNPEFYSYLLERLLAAGALDVNIIPTQMKKSRPGHLLRIMAPEALREALAEILFRETTTLGIRSLEVERISLPRRTLRVQTRYGRLRVKVAGRSGDDLTIAPEYDSCQRAARRHRAPLRRVYEEATKAARKRLAKKRR